MSIPKGLINLGNTCFINSCVQVLAQISDFDSISFYANGIVPSNDAYLFTEWVKLRSAILSHGTSQMAINPMDFIRAVHTAAMARGKILFTGMAQNDMPEFLLFLIDCMHTSISNPIEVEIGGYSENDTDELALQCFERLKHIYAKEFSDFYPLMYGLCVSRIYDNSQAEHQISATVVDHHFILDVPIPNTDRPSLHGCLELFFEPERLTDWKDEKTEMVVEHAYKQLRFWNFPKIVVIVFKRFSNSQQKNCVHIDFPHELDMSKYVVGYSPEKYKYGLFGVVNHMGGVHGGHYTAFTLTQEGAWVHCNDSSVSAVPSEHIVSENAYCLFYRQLVAQ